MRVSAATDATGEGMFVDFWDMTKVLFRRWYFALPVMVLLGLIGFAATRSVAPDYTAVGHVTLIPPEGSTDSEGNSLPIRNPWYNLGYEALSNAAMLDVTGKAAIEQIAAEGLSDSIAIDIQMYTVFNIEVVASSPEQATATVRRVMEMIEDAVAARQKAMGVTQSDMIGTLALDDGSNVETKTSKITRVAVVALGAVVLLTVGLTLGFDALLRRRAARRHPGLSDPDLVLARRDALGHTLPVQPSPSVRTPSGEQHLVGAVAPDVTSRIEPMAPPVSTDETIVLPLSGGPLRRGKGADQR